jgi:hypothetical protein
MTKKCDNLQIFMPTMKTCKIHGRCIFLKMRHGSDDDDHFDWVCKKYCNSYVEKTYEIVVKDENGYEVVITDGMSEQLCDDLCTHLRNEHGIKTLWRVTECQ